MLTILALFLFTILYEGLVVAYTLAVAERKKYWSAFFSAAIEPVKLISLLIVINSVNKGLGVAVISAGCWIGNVVIISLMEKFGFKKIKE